MARYPCARSSTMSVSGPSEVTNGFATRVAHARKTRCVSFAFLQGRGIKTSQPHAQHSNAAILGMLLSGKHGPLSVPEQQYFINASRWLGQSIAQANRCPGTA
eukprot:8748437-Pyramimonas_sp.AAC.1